MNEKMDRRKALKVAGATGAAVALAACGGTAAGGGGYGSSNQQDDKSPEKPKIDYAALDIEVGGGVVIEEEGVVVTRPSDTELKVYSATCTHQGCQVNEVRKNQIYCPCHGSVYSSEDGSVLFGPAPRALPLEETVET